MPAHRASKGFFTVSQRQAMMHKGRPPSPTDPLLSISSAHTPHTIFLLHPLAASSVVWRRKSAFCWDGTRGASARIAQAEKLAEAAQELEMLSQLLPPYNIMVSARDDGYAVPPLGRGQGPWRFDCGVA